MPDRELAAFQALVLAETGIFLSPAKRALLVNRLGRRLRALGLRSWRDYHRLVTSDPEELERCLDAVTTNETQFFREPAQLGFLVERVFPEWRERAEKRRRSRVVRVWSAGCATGEEPYTLAMLLADALPAEQGWRIEILATDLSQRVLAVAEAAQWSVARAKDVPEHYLKRYMLRGVRAQQGLMKAGPELRALVRCAQVNLNAPFYAVDGPFDLILCRNVLIYFKPERRQPVVDRLARHLAPGGYLLLGHAESLAGAADRYKSVGPKVYVPQQSR
jgi:chemotaxis protein methyltransferase CheR